MARVYLMIEDLTVLREEDTSIGWAVQWDEDGTTAKPSPESLTDAQWAMGQIADTLARMIAAADALASGGIEGEAPKVGDGEGVTSRILVPRGAGSIIV
jgi:hypothetical protein